MTRSPREVDALEMPPLAWVEHRRVCDTGPASGWGPSLGAWTVSEIEYAMRVGGGVLALVRLAAVVVTDAAPDPFDGWSARIAWTDSGQWVESVVTVPGSLGITEGRTRRHLWRLVRADCEARAERLWRWGMLDRWLPTAGLWGAMLQRSNGRERFDPFALASESEIDNVDNEDTAP